MEFFYIYIDISYFLDCRFTIFLFSFQDLYLSEQRRGGKKRIIGEETATTSLINYSIFHYQSRVADMGYADYTVVEGLLREKGEDEETGF